MQKIKQDEIDKKIRVFQEVMAERLTPEIEKTTLEGLKDFREKHWDKSLPRHEAYRKYLKLAESLLHESE